jgi:hypothetical protein
MFREGSSPEKSTYEQELERRFETYLHSVRLMMFSLVHGDEVTPYLNFEEGMQVLAAHKEALRLDRRRVQYHVVNTEGGELNEREGRAQWESEGQDINRTIPSAKKSSVAFVLKEEAIQVARKALRQSRWRDILRDQPQMPSLVMDFHDTPHRGPAYGIVNRQDVASLELDIRMAKELGLSCLLVADAQALEGTLVQGVLERVPDAHGLIIEVNKEDETRPALGIALKVLQRANILQSAAKESIDQEKVERVFQVSLPSMITDVRVYEIRILPGGHVPEKQGEFYFYRYPQQGEASKQCVRIRRLFTEAGSVRSESISIEEGDKVIGMFS